MAFLFKRKITIDRTQAGAGASLTNFPIPVNGTLNYLATTGNGGQVFNASGFDIGFYSDAALTTKLNWETVVYTATTGVVEYWVQIPTLNGGGSGSDSFIYMAYGNNAITTDQSAATATWDANSKLVMHTKDTTFADSTGVNTTTNHGATAAAGQIGNAATFVAASSQYIDLGANAALNITGPLRIGLWTRPATLPGAGIYFTVLGNLHINPTIGGFEITLAASNDPTVASKFYIATGDGVVAGFRVANANAAAVAGTTYKIDAIYDGTTLKLYINGVVQAVTATSSTAIGTSAIVPSLGRRTDGNALFYNGWIDEVRIDNTARSADWILAGYNCQKSAQTMVSIGAAIPTTSIKTVAGFTYASAVKTVAGLAVASIKTIEGFA